MFWDRLLNGALICRIVGGEAMKFSWQRLKVVLAQTILSLKPGKVPPAFGQYSMPPTNASRTSLNACGFMRYSV
jgi:hypothetical protein